MNNAENIIKEYLIKHNILNLKEKEEIISGFDLSKPVYQNKIWAGDIIFQYIRRPNTSFNEIQVGRWFSLRGATMDSLAIFSGGSGRLLTQFKVKCTIDVLEGTAKKLDRNWGWEGGGRGGATQLFIPRKLFYALVAIGSQIDR